MVAFEIFPKILKVAIGTLVTLLISVVWNHKDFFGSMKMQSCGINKAKQQAHQRKQGLITLIELISRFCTAVVFFTLVNNFQRNDFWEAFILGCWCYLGFVIPQISSWMEQRSWDYFMIVGTESFINILVLSYISSF